jgi:hypothetical protein
VAWMVHLQDQVQYRARSVRSCESRYPLARFSCLSGENSSEGQVDLGQGFASIIPSDPA